MPIYEYQCPKCGEFEVTQRITDDPLKKCPTCRSKVRKLISNTSFQLKGSGWYITDYARKGTAGKEKAEPAGDGKGESGSKTDGTAKTDTATKSETASKSDSSGSGGGKKKSESAKAA